MYRKHKFLIRRRPFTINGFTKDNSLFPVRNLFFGILLSLAQEINNIFGKKTWKPFNGELNKGHSEWSILIWYPKDIVLLSNLVQVCLFVCVLFWCLWIKQELLKWSYPKCAWIGCIKGSNHLSKCQFSVSRWRPLKLRKFK